MLYYNIIQVNRLLGSQVFQAMEKDSIEFAIQLAVCPNNNSVEIVCCNQKCKQPALVCRQQICHCIKAHKKCKFLRLQNLLFKIIDRPRPLLNQHVTNLVQNLNKIYDEMIEMISLQKQTLEKWVANYGLSLQQINLLQTVISPDIQKLKGSIINKIYSEGIKGRIRKQLQLVQIGKLQKSQKIDEQVGHYGIKEENNQQDQRFNKINVDRILTLYQPVKGHLNSILTKLKSQYTIDLQRLLDYNETNKRISEAKNTFDSLFGKIQNKESEMQDYDYFYNQFFGGL